MLSVVIFLVLCLGMGVLIGGYEVCFDVDDDGSEGKYVIVCFVK